MHGDMRNAYKTLVGEPEGKKRLLGRRIILEWILEKQGGKVWTGFIWQRMWASGRLL
jgi:hypothetical protein